MSRHWRIILAGALLLAAVGLRRTGLGVPVWNVDEAVTFTMAEQILTGDVPYRDAVDQRNPLAPYVQAAVFGVFGHWNLPAQHAVLAVMLGFAAILVWQTARRFGDEPAGVAAALWFTLCCFLLPSYGDMMAAHTGWYLMFCSCLGFWCLSRAWPDGSLRWSLAAGGAFGLSFLAKQPGLLDFGTALVLVALGAGFSPVRRKPLAAVAGGLLAGFAVPVSALFGYLAARGVWADYVYYAWTYNDTLYVPEVPWLQRWATIRVPFEQAWLWHPLVVVAGLAAIVPLLRRAFAGVRRPPAEIDILPWLILGWCAAGLISTTLTGRGFTHYSIQLIPGLSLACGWITVRLWALTQAWRARRRTHDLVVKALAGAAAVMLLLPVGQRIRELKMPGSGGDDTAALVRQHTSAAERIHVWGYNPEIYAVARRLPATRFLYDTFLTGLIPWTNLDPLQPTGYAVAPGAWDRFYEDWNLHPPAMVVDTGALRGFLKYPLERQHPLWEILQRDYAEIETELTAEIGYRLFRRLDPVAAPPALARPAPGTNLQLVAPATSPVGAVRVEVHAPAGAHNLELLVDGRSYARLAWRPDRSVRAVFTVGREDLPDGIHHLQAVTRGETGALATAEHELRTGPQFAVQLAPSGPALQFDGVALAPLEGAAAGGRPIRLKPDSDHWDAHAPSRLVYPRRPEMKSLTFSYGIELEAYRTGAPKRTDGIDAIIFFEDEGGRQTRVFRRRLDPIHAGGDIGPQVDYVELPGNGPGRLIFLMTPGPWSDSSFDWSYWTWINANRGPLKMDFAGARYPAHFAAAGGVRQAGFNGHLVTITSAPSVVEFSVPAGLAELTGVLGLPDDAWLGAAQPGGAEFEISLKQPDGTETNLLQRTLEPGTVAGDRGVRPFRLALPQPCAGTLRFQIRPHGGESHAGVQAFWGELRGTGLRTGLAAGNNEIAAGPGTEARFGFANADEGGRPCLFAHAPATLAYPWPAGATRLTGSYGIMRGAYTADRTSDGAVFVVEIEDAAGTRRELFRRHLDPERRETDRGDQALSVEIPPAPAGRLFVRTEAAPSGNLNSAWSYWRDLRVSP